MSISPASVASGEQVTVSLAGWPAGTARVTVCGDDARQPAADCDEAGGHDLEVGADGSGSTSLGAAPPVACPCVVRAATRAGELVQTLPLVVPGAAAEPPGGAEQTVGRQLAVSARVESVPLRIGELFGGRSHRVLDMTIQNTGTVPIDGLAVEVEVGRSASAGRAVPVPGPIGVLRPGEQQIVSVPLELDPPVAGRYVITGRVLGLPDPVTFDASVTTWPWVSIVLVLAAIVGALVIVGTWFGGRRRRRQRVVDRDGDDELAGRRTAHDIMPS